MTYLAFHLVFLLPPLLILLATGFPRPPRLWAYLLMPLIALVYTTPWDNYLVWQGVWGYPEGRVLLRLGYVPLEEYLFFLLQPLLTGAFLHRVAGAPPPGAGGLARVVGGGMWLLLAALGVLLLALGGRYLYLGLTLAYFAPLGLAAGPPPRGGPPHPLPLVRRRLGHPGGDLVDLPPVHPGPWGLWAPPGGDGLLPLHQPGRGPGPPPRLAPRGPEAPKIAPWPTSGRP